MIRGRPSIHKLIFATERKASPRCKPFSSAHSHAHRRLADAQLLLRIPTNQVHPSRLKQVKGFQAIAVQ